MVTIFTIIYFMFYYIMKYHHRMFVQYVIHYILYHLLNSLLCWKKQKRSYIFQNITLCQEWHWIRNITFNLIDKFNVRWGHQVQNRSIDGNSNKMDLYPKCQATWAGATWHTISILPYLTLPRKLIPKKNILFFIIRKGQIPKFIEQMKIRNWISRLLLP